MTRFDRGILGLMFVSLVAMALIVNGAFRDFSEGLRREVRLLDAPIVVENAIQNEDGRLVVLPADPSVCPGDVVRYYPNLRVVSDARIEIDRWLKRRTPTGSETLRSFDTFVFAVEAGDLQRSQSLEVDTTDLEPGAYYLLVGFSRSEGRTELFYRVPFEVRTC